jgi:hypothetical protein
MEIYFHKCSRKLTAVRVQPFVGQCRMAHALCRRAGRRISSSEGWSNIEVQSWPAVSGVSTRGGTKSISITHLDHEPWHKPMEDCLRVVAGAQRTRNFCTVVNRVGMPGRWDRPVYLRFWDMTTKTSQSLRSLWVVRG